MKSRAKSLTRTEAISKRECVWLGGWCGGAVEGSVVDGRSLNRVRDVGSGLNTGNAPDFVGNLRTVLFEIS